MARVVKDRIKQTSTTTGTGTVSLSASVAGYQNFSVLGDGNTTFYCIEDANGTAFEVGIGTYTSNTLARTTILDSTNSGNAISLTSGTHDVFVTYPAGRAGFNDEGLSPTLTASGTVTAGKPVIQNTNGTVTQVTGTTTTTDTGSLTQFETGSIEGVSSAYDSSNDRVVVAYRDISNSGYGTAVVGTVDNFAISFGTPVVFESASTNSTTTVFDSNSNKIVISYQDTANSRKGTSIVGTVSGTSISFGSPVIFANADTRSTNSCFDSSNNKVVIAYKDQDNSQYGTAIVGTVSGTSISFGSEAVFESGNTAYIEPVFDSNSNKVVIFYADIGDNFYPKAVVGTVSSTSISFGSIVTINSAQATSMAAVFDSSANKTVCAFGGGGGNKGAVGTVSGTSISFGTLTTVAGAGTNNMINQNASFDSANNKSVFVYYDSNNSNKATRIFATVSGTDVSFSSAVVVVDESNSYYITTTFDSTSNKFISSAALPTTGGGSAIVYSTVDVTTTTTNLTNDNYFGVASNSATTNNPVQINVPGSINNAQTGLNVDKDYYVTNLGLLKERTTTTTTTNSNISSSNGDKFADVFSYTRDISVAYDTVNNKIGILYVATSTNYPTIVIAEESNNALTYGTPVVVNSQTSYNGNAGQKLVYGNGVFVMCYSWESYPIYLKAGVYSGTNSITLGSQIQPDTGTGYLSNATIGYNPNANKFVYIFPVANTSSINVYLITNSGTTLTTGNSATITMGYNSNNRVISNLYDPDTNKQVIMTDHLYGNEGRIYQATISGANITVPSTHYAITDEGTEEEGSKALSYDPDNDKWILFKANTGNVLRANVLTASGDTFTSGTVTQISSNYFRWLAPYYDTEQNKTILTYRYNNGQPYYAGIGFVTISGTTPSFTASSTTLGNTATSGSSQYNQPHQAIYNPDTKSGIVVAAFSTSTPSDGMGVVLYYGTTASTVVNGSVFAGTALSATALELKTFPASTIVGKADGAVTKGKAVIVEADGDFAQAGLTSTSVTNSGTASQGSLGSMGTYVTDMFAMAVAKDGLTYCFTYQNGSTQQACKIGTRSGETISWGSELVLASANSGSHFVSYDDEANVFLTTYTTGDTVKGTAVSFSGNTGTKGTEVTIMDLGGSSGNPSYNYQHWFDATNKVTVCWARGGVSGNNTNRSSAVALTITGTSISVGTLYENTSAGGSRQKGCDVTGGKHVLYWNNGNGYPSTMTMTVTSSGAISWGTALIINSASGSFANPIYNPNYPDKVIIAGVLINSTYSYAGFNISGTSIATANFNSGAINNANSYVESGGNMGVYSNYSGNYCFVYQTYSPYNSRYNFATTTDGLTLTVATAVTTTGHGSSQFYAGACASDVDAVVVENHNDRSSSPGTYAYYCFNPTFNFTSTTQGPNFTVENYIGIAQETVSTGNDVKVTTISGVDANQSSLTPAQLYYVQTDGTISTTAGSPSVVAGTAIAATQLLVSRS